MVEKISVNMIVRNGEDFVLPCLEAVLPFASQVLVTVDSRSRDQTKTILYGLQKKWSKLGVYVWKVDNPLLDLVAMRNDQLERSTGEWVWIVDSDEYYLSTEIPKMWQTIGDLHIEEDCNFFSVKTISPWTMTLCHRGSSNIMSGAKVLRIVRNSPRLKWLGSWGKEQLTYNSESISDRRRETKNHRRLNFSFIHFTHWKKDAWRQEMNQLRIADARCLKPMSSAIIKELETLNNKYFIYEKMSLVQRGKIQDGH